jgi:uncharacterized membrane protein YkvA (DUF1232 family)
MSGKLGGRIVRGALFAQMKEKAIGYLKDPDKLRDLTQQAGAKASDYARSGALSGVFGSLTALLRLLRAYVRGEYRNVPPKSLILIVAAVLYFLLPIDVIPDFIVGLGFIDDAAVLAWVASTVKTVLDDFTRWETTQAGVESGPLASRAE